MENNIEVKVLVMVVNAGFAEEVVEIAREAGLKGATIINARGEGESHRSILGITIDTEKEMILSVIEKSTVASVMAAVKEKAGISTPAHCVCFAMPVDTMVGIDMTD